jgi:hypothetical protein
MNMLKVRYVGLKDRETDTKTAQTGITWVGHGCIREVPASAWLRLSRHPDVWELVAGQKVSGLSDAPRPAPRQEVLDEELTALTTVIKPVEQEVQAAPAEQPAPAAKGPDLYEMNTAALREFAAKQNLAVDTTLKGQALRDAISAALKA